MGFVIDLAKDESTRVVSIRELGNSAVFFLLFLLVLFDFELFYGFCKVVIQYREIRPK